MSNEITIDSAEMYPVPTTGRNGCEKYPWDQLKVGESFLATVTISNIGNSRNRAEKRTGFKFTTRTVEGGTRVWRVA